MGQTDTLDPDLSDRLPTVTTWDQSLDNLNPASHSRHAKDWWVIMSLDPIMHEQTRTKVNGPAHSNESKFLNSSIRHFRYGFGCKRCRFRMDRFACRRVLCFRDSGVITIIKANHYIGESTSQTTCSRAPHLFGVSNVSWYNHHSRWWTRWYR